MLVNFNNMYCWMACVYSCQILITNGIRPNFTDGTEKQDNTTA